MTFIFLCVFSFTYSLSSLFSLFFSLLSLCLACLETIVFDVILKEPTSVNISLYFVDWFQANTMQVVEVRDPNNFYNIVSESVLVCVRKGEKG